MSSILERETTPQLLLLFVAVVIAAPLADELFFRGLLLHGLSPRLGATAAVLITAVLTALFHTLEPFKLTHAFIMGVIFAASVVWTRSVYTSIVLHALHNGMAMIPQI